MLTTGELIYVICEVIVATEGIICNMAVLTAIYKHHSLHLACNAFVAQLAAADLVVALFGIPCAIILHLDIELGYWPCINVSLLHQTITCSPIIILICITLDRFFAIRFPLRYLQVIDYSRAFHVGMTMWVLFALLPNIPIYLLKSDVISYKDSHDHEHHSMGPHHNSSDICNKESIYSDHYHVFMYILITFLIPVFIMLCVYAYIWLIVKRIQRKDSFKNQFVLRRKVKITKTFFTVLAVFTCTSLPVIVIDFVHLRSGEQLSTMHHLLLAASVIQHLEIIFNPFIYTNGSMFIKHSLLRAHGLKSYADRLFLVTTEYERPNLHRRTKEMYMDTYSMIQETIELMSPLQTRRHNSMVPNVSLSVSGESLKLPKSSPSLHSKLQKSTPSILSN